MGPKKYSLETGTIFSKSRSDDPASTVYTDAFESYVSRSDA